MYVYNLPLPGGLVQNAESEAVWWAEGASQSARLGFAKVCRSWFAGVVYGLISRTASWKSPRVWCSCSLGCRCRRGCVKWCACDCERVPVVCGVRTLCCGGSTDAGAGGQCVDGQWICPHRHAGFVTVHHCGRRGDGWHGGPVLLLTRSRQVVQRLKAGKCTLHFFFLFFPSQEITQPW